MFGKIYVAFIIIFILLTFSLQAGEEKNPTPKILNLNECIALAVKNNLEIKVEDSNIELFQEKKKFIEGKKILPQFTMEHLIGPVPDATGDIFTDPSSFDLNIDHITEDLGVFYKFEVKAVQPIYTFGKISSLENIAKLGVDVAELKKGEKHADIISKVSTVYYLINMLNNLQTIIDDGREKLGEAKKKVTSLLEKGSTKVSIFDEYKIEVFELELDKNELEVQSKKTIAINGLKALLAIDYDFEIEEITKKPDEYDLKDFEFYQQEALTKRPDFQQLEKALKIRENQTTIGVAKFLPDIFAGGLFRYGIAPGRTDQHNPFVKDDFNYLVGGVGIGLKQDLDFWSTDREYRQAKIELQKLKNQKQLALSGIKLEVSKNYESVMSEKKKFEVAKESIRTTRKWLTQALNGFENFGTNDVKEVKDAFIEYAKARKEFYATIFEFEKQRIELEKSTGTI